MVDTDGHPAQVGIGRQRTEQGQRREDEWNPGMLGLQLLESLGGFRVERRLLRGGVGAIVGQLVRRVGAAPESRGISRPSSRSTIDSSVSYWNCGSVRGIRFPDQGPGPGREVRGFRIRWGSRPANHCWAELGNRCHCWGEVRTHRWRRPACCSSASHFLRSIRSAARRVAHRVRRRRTRRGGIPGRGIRIGGRHDARQCSFAGTHQNAGLTVGSEQQGGRRKVQHAGRRQRRAGDAPNPFAGDAAGTEDAPRLVP